MDSRNQSSGAPKLGVPFAQLTAQGQTPTDYVLIQPDGNVWSSYTDRGRVHDVIRQSQDQFQKATTG